MIRRERVTAQLHGDFVVFLVGMRIDRPWPVDRWMPVARAMPRMLAELHRRPELGLLQAQTRVGRTFLVLQYWRSTAPSDSEGPRATYPKRIIRSAPPRSASAGPPAPHGVSMSLPLKSLLVATLASTLSTAAVAQAPAAPSRIRGEIVSVSGDTLVVHRTNSDNVTIAWKAETPVGAVKNVKLADIKPGSYVGAASVPDASGKQVAKEVLVFPEAMRGSGDGHYAWDLLPGSMMTNANVDTVVQGSNGRELTMSYKGGSKTVFVPESAPVVTFTDATHADVVAGRKVFVVAKLLEPGKYEANRVVVEKDGVAPPM